MRLICSAVLLAVTLQVTFADGDFQSAFKSSPQADRILKIIHGWPDAPAAQDNLIRSLSEQGFGGVVCNVSFQEYLQSEQKWQAFSRAVQKAKAAGFHLWLYDEKGYPSATAGGLVLKDHPEWEAQGLLIADEEVESGPVTLKLPPGQAKLIAAYPVRAGVIDLRGRTNLSARVSSRQLTWTPPAGRWHVFAITLDHLYEGTHAALNLADHIPYPNLLDPQPTAKFLELTHDAYAKHLGTNLGQSFVSTFTDEPSLMSLFLKPMPYRVLPWSETLPSSFRKQWRYSLEDKLPALLADAGSETAHVRYDYWSTVGTMVSSNFLGQIQKWCSAHNVLSGGHLLMEENLVNQVPLYGDFFQCLRRLDSPGIDCLTSVPEQVPWFIARLAASAAELEGRNIVMCETSDHSQRYRPPGDARPVRKVSEHEIRGTCNRLMVSGVDVITSYYSFDGLDAAQLRQLNEYIGRCCYALKSSHQAADIAVLYPVESVWTHFTPARHYANSSPQATAIENTCRDVSESLFSRGRDFTYIDGRTLAEAKVDHGCLVHGKLRWRVVVLPGVDTLPLKAWKNLSAFVDSGGAVISVGSLPLHSESEFLSPQVQRLGDHMFGQANKAVSITSNKTGGAGIFIPAGLATLVPEIVSKVLEADCEVSQNGSPLRYTHRRNQDQELYFVVNDSNQPWRGYLSLCVDGQGEQHDPLTGRSTVLPGGQGIELELGPYGGTLFTFSKGHLPARLPVEQGSIPEFATWTLPAVEPTVARGEFVREKLSRKDQKTQPKGAKLDAACWEAAASLTKSNTDTFLFLRFQYPVPITVRGGRAVVLDSWVPEDQRAPAQLLLILHEKGGADYMANTGRLLSSPGYEQSWVSLDRFQLAGWSQDANGRLDPDDISEIRVGWGGYLGEENETVTFCAAAPSIARLTTATGKQRSNTSPTSSAADLRSQFEQIGLTPRLQGGRPTCSVFTVVGALEFATAKSQGYTPRLSVEYLNWAGNQVCGESQDGGFFSDLWKGFAKLGICSETLMPYERAFDGQRAPTAEATADAKTRTALPLKLNWIKEWNVNTGLTDAEFAGIKRTLQQSWPVCGGFRWPVHEKWEKDVLQMCSANAVRDGHSVLLVGFRDDAAQPGGGVFIFRNSGAAGRDGYMPYAYAREFMNDAAWVGSEPVGKLE